MKWHCGKAVAQDKENLGDTFEMIAFKLEPLCVEFYLKVMPFTHLLNCCISISTISLKNPF